MRRIDGRDVLLTVGLVGLLYGVAQWWAPAAWMVGGLLALSAWLWPHVRKG